MNGLIGQTPSELLTLMIDGELSDAESTALFAQLSTNQDLRAELQEFLKIRESVKNDVEAFTPPIEATKSVFAALGLNPPAAIAPMTKATASLPFFAKWGSTLLIAIVASLLTGLTVAGIYENRIDYFNSNQAQFASSEQSMPNTSSTNLSSIPVVSSTENQYIESQETVVNNITSMNKTIAQQKSTTTISNGFVVDNNIASTNDSELAAEQYISDNQTSSDEFRPILSASNNQFNNFGILTSYNTNANLSLNNAIPLLDKSNEKPAGYMLSINGSLGNNLSESSLTGASTGLSIGLYLIESNNLRIGFIGGSEPFGIRLLNETSGEYENDPASAVTWAGVVGRFEAKNWQLTDNTYPILMGVLGSTEYGMMAKAGMGLEYCISNNFATSVCAEYTMLRYANQLQTDTYSKIGIIGSFIVKF